MRIIFHVDANSAFLSWEAVYRLHHLCATVDLREIPSAVGGDQKKRHGIILAKSIPAKKYKVQTGEPVVDAKRKCPDLVLVPPNYSLYNRSSHALIELLSKYADKIEQYSIDEAFMDMNHFSENWGKQNAGNNGNLPGSGCEPGLSIQRGKKGMRCKIIFFLFSQSFPHPFTIKTQQAGKRFHASIEESFICPIYFFSPKIIEDNRYSRRHLSKSRLNYLD